MRTIVPLLSLVIAGLLPFSSNAIENNYQDLMNRAGCGTVEGAKPTQAAICLNVQQTFCCEDSNASDRKCANVSCGGDPKNLAAADCMNDVNGSAQLGPCMQNIKQRGRELTDQGAQCCGGGDG